MANLSEDIQCAGSDTQPPMLDRTDFASWQQRIRLYCRGKENGLELPRVYSDLSPEDKERMQLNSKFVNNMLSEWGRFVTAIKLNRGLRDSNYDQLYAYLKQHEAHVNENKMNLIKMKAEALKKQTTASRPIKALTVYSPNTPTMLVLRVLPTKRERGFEQTKECYLTEVIPFFKTLKEHSEGIQKALTKEIKEMKDVFEELEAGVDQNVLNVSRFTKMHDDHTIVEARCLELEAELSNLGDKIQNDNHNELVKRFSKLEITRAKHLEQTTALTTKNENLKAQMQTKMKSVTKDHVKPTVLAPGKYAIDVEPIPPRNRNNREVHLDYLRHLKESVETLREIVEEAKVERPLDRL
ncbi:hypothetical protein Tco_1211236 [Tanacetum coccineum]